MSSTRRKSKDGSLKEGWLEKKGSFVRSWKRRYFVLTSSALNYYTDETLSELKGSVPIVSTSRVMHRDGSSHQFKFGVCTGKRLLEIACTSDEHRTRWKKCIQELINRLQVEDMKAGGACCTPPEKTTVFNDLMGINRLDRTNMVEDTPMNRARKKQEAKLAQQKLGKLSPQQSAGAGTGSKLKKDKQEDALWGGEDSDVSESESESEGEEARSSKTSCQASKAKKGARRRLNGGGNKPKRGTGERGSERDSGFCDGDSPHDLSQQQTTSHNTSSSGKNAGIVGPDLQGLKLGGEAHDGWEELVSDKGELYYYHRDSKITRWEKPTPEVTQCIHRRLEEERLQSERANEKRKLELKQNKIVEEELQDYTNQIQATVTQQIQLWKHPVGKKRARVLGELLNAVPALLGPEVIPLDSSLVSTPLLKTDPPVMVKKAYRKVVRLVHPDKIAGTGCVIDMEKKMLAAEVFITINEAFEKFRAQYEDL